MAKNVWYTIAKRYYDMGIYSKEQVKLFVTKGRISKEEYEEIIGENFETEIQE